MSYNERHIFPGANTPQGFFSYFNNIIDKTKAARVYCLKGGPGVGKSSYMKQVANAFHESDMQIEYLHCSSDPFSLDGIHFPEYGIALLDGTSPHITDPIYPGAVDEIINLGRFWRAEGIRSHKEEIISTQTNISYEFSRAYRYLYAAESIDRDSTELLSSAFNQDAVQEFGEKLSQKIFGDYRGETGRTVRRMFASAITPAGLINYSDTILYNCKHIYAISTGENTGGCRECDKVMDMILSDAARRNIHCEAYYCPMRPAKSVEHIVIPELETGITVLNKYNSDESLVTNMYDLREYANKAILRSNSEKIDENIHMYAELLRLALRALKDAYWLHNAMEAYYVPNMDFAQSNEQCDKTIAEIQQMIEKKSESDDKV